MKHNPIITAIKEGGFASTFVRRPVLAIVLNLLIIVAGAAAYFGVEVRELPSIDRPVITVRTGYNGATPETVDKQITGVIEGAVARTSGITNISSVSTQGNSRVTLEFSPATDINVAAADLRDAVSNVRGLPRDDNLVPPAIVKADVQQSDAIMRVVAVAPKMAADELTQLVNDRIVNKLAAVDGVADVQLFGNRNPLVRIMFDPAKLAARSLTVTDLSNAVANIATDAPAGNVSDANRTLVVRTDNTAKTVDDIKAVPLNRTTRVEDVAQVVFGPEDKTTTIRFNGQTGVSLDIYRQAKSNALSISNGVRKAVEDLNAQLASSGVKVEITSDDAVFIRGSVEEVIKTLVFATGIVLAIIFIFLRSVRVTIIPMVTVPIALIGALGAIWASGFSINLLTLLALVLATGLVVDDAIVVIENIIRRRNEGMGPRAAAVLGTKQVFFAVVATTATLVAVFVPISFFPGSVGKLFREFGFVLAFSVMLSAFVALTLVPMMASRLVSAEGTHSANPVMKFFRVVFGPVNWVIDTIGSTLLRIYRVLLNAALAAPLVVLALAFVFAYGAFTIFRTLNVEIAPLEDRGLIQLFVGAPQGSTVDYTSDQMKQVEAITTRLLQPRKQADGKPDLPAEATGVVTVAQGFGGGGFMTITLAPWESGRRTQREITAELNRQLAQVVGVQANARPPVALGIPGSGNGLQFAVTGSDYVALSDAATGFVRVLQGESAIFQNPRTNFDLTQAQIKLTVDRQRASELGISVDAITTVINTLLSGRNIGNFFIGETPIRIRILAPEGMIQDPTALDNIQIRIGGQPGTANAKMVPLSSLVSFQEMSAAPQLPRQDQRASLPMTSGLAEGVTMGVAMQRLNELAKEHLPAGMNIVYTGEAKALLQTSSGIIQTFGFAVLVVLLVLAAQFESFIAAFILFATVPFGLAAAVFAMAGTGTTLNTYSEIGLVMLVGLMAKNGILIVEFANQLRDEGQSVGESIRNACMIRIRPVVMTMLATVFGALPLILEEGPGSEARHALGYVIVGGLSFATVFTLFLTPVVFDLLARLTKPRTAEEHRLAKELSDAGKPPAVKKPELVPAAGPAHAGEELPVAAE